MSQKLTSARKQARLDRLNEALDYADKLIAILEAIYEQEGRLYDVKCAIYQAKIAKKYIESTHELTITFGDQP